MSAVPNLVALELAGFSARAPVRRQLERVEPHARAARRHGRLSEPWPAGQSQVASNALSTSSRVSVGTKVSMKPKA